MSEWMEPLSVRVPVPVKNTLKKQADARNISLSDHARIILTDNMEEYGDLDAYEERYAEIQEQRNRERIHETIAQRYMREQTFPEYLKQRARYMYNEWNMAEEDIARWMEHQFPIAEMRGCRGAVEELHRQIETGQFRWTMDDTTPKGATPEMTTR